MRSDHKQTQLEEEGKGEEEEEEGKGEGPKGRSGHALDVTVKPDDDHEEGP